MPRVKSTEKFTFIPKAAIAIPKSRYANLTRLGTNAARPGIKVPATLARIKPSMNHGIGTGCFSPVGLACWVAFWYQIPTKIATGAKSRTRESLVMIAVSRLTGPPALPAATAWAISCRLPPVITPNCRAVMCKSGLSPISIRVKRVPRIATIATATTSFSWWRNLVAGSSSLVNCDEIPITAAAPQIPVPLAVRIAKWRSTPKRRASW